MGPATLLLCLTLSLGPPAASANPVELTEKTFAGAVEGKSAFVLFYAPWCGHCKKVRPEWDRLQGDYKASRTVLIADVDCTAAGQSLCSKHGVQGYPTIKVFKKDKDASRGEDYNGPREYAGFKQYVEANLAGPECSLEDKEGCSSDERKVLEESEAMSVAERRQKVSALEAEIKEKRQQAKALEADAKKLASTLQLVKLGGEKPERVEQLLGDAEFREHCEHRTCILAFLPHILDGGAAARNGYVQVMEAVFKKAKAEGTPAGFMWLQGGDQYEIEEMLSLQFGFPAVIALNLKKQKYGVHRGILDKEGLSQFLKSMMIGKVPLSPVPKNLPKFQKVEPWDGKDAQPQPEEEL